MFHRMTEEILIVKMPKTQSCVKGFCLGLVYVNDQSCYLATKGSRTVDLSCEELGCDASASIFLKNSYRIQIEFTRFGFLQLCES